MNKSFYRKPGTWTPRPKPPPSGTNPGPERYRFPRWQLAVAILMLLILAGASVFFALQTDQQSGVTFDHVRRPETSALKQKIGRPQVQAEGGFITFALDDLAVEETPPAKSIPPLEMARAMSLLRQAQKNIRDRNLDTAEKQIHKAMGIWPEMGVALRLLGTIHARRGEHERAMALLEQALRKEPFSVVTMNNLATSYLHAGMNTKAAELLQTALKIQPDYTLAQLNLGLAQMYLGQYQQAAINLEASMNRMPEPDGGVVNNLAFSLIQLGFYNKARGLLEGLIDTEPERASAYFNLATIYLREKNRDAALSWLQRGAELTDSTSLIAILEHQEFNALRQDPAFIALMKPAPSAADKAETSPGPQ